MNKNFYLGLDIGTDSCGWALTDENYNLVRVSGKDAWGVRLFANAEVAAGRRQKRTARRRLQRRRLQNEWLREVFYQEIEKVDPKFFDRLKYSNLHREDKEKMGISNKYSLFNDVLKDVYTDKEYYKAYKTVYHLREKLLSTPADDIRLLYLAVHSILTHRGHFLYSVGSSSSDNEMDKMFNELVDCLKELFAEEDNVSEKENKNKLGLGYATQENFEKLVDDLGKVSLRQTKENFASAVGAKSKKDKDVIKAIVNGQFKLGDIFNGIEKEDNLDVNFGSDTYETDTYGKILELIGNDQDKVEIVNKLNELYSNIQLKKLLGKHVYICQALVAKYDIHNEQLNKFKDFIKTYYPSKKALVFRVSRVKKEKNKEKDSTDKKSKTFSNYANYVYSNLVNGKKQVMDETATQENFYAFVKKEILEKEPEREVDENYENSKKEILDLIEKGAFLPKIRSHENIVLPKDLYKKELEKILAVSSEKFTFLREKDDSGLTNAEKIVQIIFFRVPYFVGPIGDSDAKYSWVEKKKDMSLRPWNIEAIVDFNEAEDKFIQRMTNKCTYLRDKDVLPKDSLLYSKFRVLNELNNLKLDGKGISNELKKKIFNELFKKNKKVSIGKLKEFLVAENIVSKDHLKDLSITGIDKDFANNLSSYFTLSNKFGEEFVDKNADVFEKIIKYHTIISDKSRLEARLSREFGDLFSEEEYKFLKSLNYSNWGRLSKEFLAELPFSAKNKEQKINDDSFSEYYIEKCSNGEALTVIETLWETNNNLQQLFDTGNYTLADVVEKNSDKLDRDIEFSDIDEMYCSPSVKRGAWQAIKIIKELKSKIGKYPDKIFIEVTRHDELKGDAGRKDSRKKKIEKLYKNDEVKKMCESLSIEYNELMRQLMGEDGKSGKTESELRSDRLYLYFMQLGKCMYTGETLDISKLGDDTVYNIEHIIPRCKIKDDSLNNIVLVKAQANLAKGDHYPISEHNPEIQSKQGQFWKMLNEKGLLSNEKYSRLIRTEPFNEREEIAFVNRQIVETNQESKAVADLLRRVVSDEKSVIFSKAGYVSDFRKKFDIYKSREVNSFHHAKDAYLNVVVGNVIYNRFTIPYWNSNIKNDVNKDITRNTLKIFERVVKSPLDGSIVWNGVEQKADEDAERGDIVRIKNICCRNSCLLTEMSFVNNNGMFYDETLYKSKKNDPKTKASFPLKGENKMLSNTERYGGYNSLKGAYFTVVESIDKKGKTKKTIESVPIVIEYQYRNEKDKQQKIIEYLEKQNNIKITKVIMPVIRYNSTLKINGGLYTLTGKSADSLIIHKQSQWFINNNDIKYCKDIKKYKNLSDKAKESLARGDDYIILSPAKKENAKEIRLTRERNIKLYDMMIAQLNKKIYNISPIKNIVVKLEQSRQTFEKLSMDKQLELLDNIVSYIGGSFSVDLVNIGGAPMAGTTLINKNITDVDIRLVKQSVTGLIQKEIEL